MPEVLDPDAYLDIWKGRLIILLGFATQLVPCKKKKKKKNFQKTTRKEKLFACPTNHCVLFSRGFAGVILFPRNTQNSMRKLCTAPPELLSSKIQRQKVFCFSR